jgi:hypothetical protein
MSVRLTHRPPKLACCYSPSGKSRLLDLVLSRHPQFLAAQDCVHLESAAHVSTHACIYVALDTVNYLPGEILEAEAGRKRLQCVYFQAVQQCNWPYLLCFVETTDEIGTVLNLYSICSPQSSVVALK